MTPASAYRRPAPARAWGLAGATVTLAGFALCIATYPQSGVAIGPRRTPLSIFELRSGASARPAFAEPKPAARRAGPARRDPPTSEPQPRPAALPDAAAPAERAAIVSDIIAPSRPSSVPPAVSPIAIAQPAPAKRNDSLRDAYAAMLWQRIATRRPDGLHLPGTALILFTLDGAGRLTAIAVRQSSGSALLDRIAMRTVRQAAPFPAPPDGIDDPTFSIAFHFD